MDEIKNVVYSTIDLMEQNNRGVQLGCYAVALVGLSVAVRRVRPFSRFRKPSDIPNHFIRERRELTGLVESINPKGPVLMIRHKPLIPLPGTPEGQLPIRISGVKVSNFGLNWIQSIVVGNEVKFIPISKAQNYVQCQVLLPQITRKNKEHNLNVGETLIKVGFGHVADTDRTISRDPSFITYCKRLQVAENYALRKKLGFKYYMKPAYALGVFIRTQFRIFVANLYNQIMAIPKVTTT